MPQRCSVLPPSLFGALRGVDLVLHAGDVGELQVLNELSSIAPVVAVHGNDETVEAQKALPYQQVIAIGGQRLFLCHAHYPDRAEELASRRDDGWGPKLDHRAAMARSVGASIAIFGHTHIPMVKEHGGVLLINPGAIAPANAAMRQLRQTVALLTLRAGVAPVVTHIDLADTAQPWTPEIDWHAGFRAAFTQFSASILAPDLQQDWQRIDQKVRELAPEEAYEIVLRQARRCWSGEQPAITREGLLAEVGADTFIPELLRHRLTEIIQGPGATPGTPRDPA